LEKRVNLRLGFFADFCALRPLLLPSVLSLFDGRLGQRSANPPLPDSIPTVASDVRDSTNQRALRSRCPARCLYVDSGGLVVPPLTF